MRSSSPKPSRPALISGTVRQSAALSCFTTVPTGTKDSVVPVLSRDIEAGWLRSDTGLKRVDAPKWGDEHLVAEELAVLVPIPNAVIADQTFNITAAMQPLFIRAMARGIDRAAMFGVDKPAGWPSPSLLEAATAAGNTVEAGADPVEDLMAAAEMPSAQGYIVNRAVVRPGWQFAAARVRAHDLIANPAGAAEPFPLIVAGLPLYLDPPAWRSADRRRLRHRLLLLPDRDPAGPDDHGAPGRRDHRRGRQGAVLRDAAGQHDLPGRDAGRLPAGRAADRRGPAR